MAKRITDDEQNLRRKARRRLIGAVALTLVVVIVLPMVLDREPKPSGRDIELNIPDPDKSGDFIPHVADRERSADNAQAVSAVEMAAIPSEKKPPLKEAKPVVREKVQTAVPKPLNPKAADKPASAVTESFVAQTGAYSNPDTAKQELSKLKKWGFKAYIEKAGDTTRVRVGPYPDRDKAEKAAHLLEKHGLHPVVMSAK
jgi:DedD protein